MLGDVSAIYLHDEYGMETLTCTTPPAYHSMYSNVIPVEVSIDNTSFTSAGLLFQYTTSAPSILLPDRGSMVDGLVER